MTLICCEASRGVLLDAVPSDGLLSCIKFPFYDAIGFINEDISSPLLHLKRFSKGGHKKKKKKKKKKEKEKEKEKEKRTGVMLSP